MKDILNVEIISYHRGENIKSVSNIKDLEEMFYKDGNKINLLLLKNSFHFYKKLILKNIFFYKKMSKILSIVNGIINQYQDEIHNKNPSISLQQLKDIWKTINDEKDVKNKSSDSSEPEKVKLKKKKTAYQNFFVIARKEVTQENQNLKFGEISKIISGKWNLMNPVEKKQYEVKEEDIMENYKQKSNSNNNYIHLFENECDDDEKDCNRIDYEEDEIDIEEEDEDEDDINFDDIE